RHAAGHALADAASDDVRLASADRRWIGSRSRCAILPRRKEWIARVSEFCVYGKSPRPVQHGATILPRPRAVADRRARRRDFLRYRTSGPVAAPARPADGFRRRLAVRDFAD